jgi:uncharacterized hydrophobic protein (TIGR00271 family)
VSHSEGATGEQGSTVPPKPPPRSWPEAWVQATLNLASVSPQRRATVLTDILEGSKPTIVYYALLGLSELIAGFALIIDSDATLIGANVVAPLMTPIFGVSLGLTRGDLRLLRTALMAEFGGALFGVALTFVLGLMPFALQPTAALLAQTRPTLIDLLVAALAGFAGGLAMIDERVSPALPGVAIATALNPPIAAVGLCLALGAYHGAWGAFLLFFANFLAILAVGAALFIFAGFVTRAEIGSLGSLARRFAAAAVGLLLVTALLTDYLIGMVRNLRRQETITMVLDQELAEEPSTALTSVDFTSGPDGIDVLSIVRTPRVMAPQRVKKIQEVLSDRLHEPVHLFMRCSLTKDVTATGTTSLRPYLSLNGKVTEAPMAPEMRVLHQAEQVVREYLATRPDIVLNDIDLVQLPVGPVVVVAIESPRDPQPAGIARFEALLRDRLRQPDLHLVVRLVDSEDLTAKGRILFGDAHFGELSAEATRLRQTVEDTVRSRVQSIPNMFATAVDAVPRGSGWAVRAEVTGPRVLTPAEVRDVQQRAVAAVGQPVELSVLANPQLVISASGYEPISQVGRPAIGPTTSPAPTP